MGRCFNLVWEEYGIKRFERQSEAHEVFSQNIDLPSEDLQTLA